jgi:hypothetical protein
MQTSPLAPGSNELIPQSFQMPPSSSVFFRGSLAPTDTITFHSEAQPSEQEPSQESSSSLTDCFSSVLAFVQNIPSILWNFFTGIVSYCLSFCSSQDPLRQEEEAARVFLTTPLEGTAEEKQAALIGRINALPQTVKGFFFSFLIFKLIEDKKKTDPIAQLIATQLQEIIAEVAGEHPIVLKLFVHAWLIQRNMPAFNSSSSSTHSNLSDEQITAALEEFQNAIGHTYDEIKDVSKETYLGAVNALPGEIKEYLYTRWIWTILGNAAEKKNMNLLDFNADFNALVLETINPTNQAEVNEKIANCSFKNRQDTASVIEGLIWHRKREAALANIPS